MPFFGRDPGSVVDNALMQFYPQFARMIKDKRLMQMRKEGRMFDIKSVADLITATRGILGLVMVWLGLTQGERALPIVIPMMILCWSGDFFDGMLARRSRHPRKSYIGNHDVQIDLFVSICLGLYMLLAGFVSISIGVWYLIGWALIFWWFGTDHNLLMLAQTPIYLYFILIGLRDYPTLGYLMVIWVMLATTILWRRFSQEVVPHFIQGMKSLWGHDNRPHKF
jgi:hypothetical protein